MIDVILLLIYTSHIPAVAVFVAALFMLPLAGISVSIGYLADDERGRARMLLLACVSPTVAFLCAFVYLIVGMTLSVCRGMPQILREADLYDKDRRR